jgi:hypothetical protein
MRPVCSELTRLQYLYILSIYYTGMHFLIKSAFLTYYLRLSPNRRFRTWIGVGYGLNFGSLIVGLLLLVFQCIPVKAALSTLARLNATCMDRDFVLFAPSSMVLSPQTLSYAIADKDRTFYSTYSSLSCPYQHSQAYKCPVVERSPSSPSLSLVLGQ